MALCGTEYPLRFSLRVVKAVQEKFGSLEKLLDAVSLKAGAENGSLGVVDECLWLLERMLDAGARYAEREGLEHPPLPDGELLLDALDIPDLQAALFAAIAGDSARTVEAEPGKNGAGAAAER